MDNDVGTTLPEPDGNDADEAGRVVTALLVVGVGEAWDADDADVCVSVVVIEKVLVLDVLPDAPLVKPLPPPPFPLPPPVALALAVPPPTPPPALALVPPASDVPEALTVSDTDVDTLCAVVVVVDAEEGEEGGMDDEIEIAEDREDDAGVDGGDETEGAEEGVLVMAAIEVAADAELVAPPLVPEADPELVPPDELTVAEV